MVAGYEVAAAYFRFIVYFVIKCSSFVGSHLLPSLNFATLVLKFRRKDGAI